MKFKIEPSSGQMQSRNLAYLKLAELNRTHFLLSSEHVFVSVSSLFSGLRVFRFHFIFK